MTANSRRRGKATRADKRTGLLCLTANVGSLGRTNATTREVCPEGQAVRQQLLDTMVHVNNKYGKIDAMMIQECGHYDVKFPPFFAEGPLATSEHVTHGAGQGGTRGTSIYVNNEGSFRVNFDRDTVNEMCAVVCYRKNPRGEKVGTALVNCYRNQSANFERTTQQTVQAINRIRTYLRTVHSVDQIFVQGDFNDERVSVPGLERRHDVKLFHKKGNSRRTYIDLAFTNIKSCGVLDVFPSCENVHGGADKTNKTIFGHKVGLFWIGVKPKPPEKRKIKVVSMKRLKEVSEEFKKELLGKDKSPNLSEEDHIEKLCKEITDATVSLMKKAEITKVAGKSRNDFVLMRAVEIDSDTNYKSKTPYKPLYRLMARVKEGCSDVAANSRKPSSIDFQTKLSKKLETLNVADRELLTRQVHELFPINETREGRWERNFKKFKNLILSTSNSAAKDYMGMSLRFTKIMLGHSPILLNRFQEIAELCFIQGYFPDIWRQDQITFLYKNKGEYSNADNWRPITISPSLGKHLEKTIVHFISNMNKGNDDNHAYTRGRSCLSAIAAVQSKLIKASNPYDYNKNKKGMKTITIFSTDDIKSAFESVDHWAVAECIRRAYAGQKYNIGGLIETYLNRRSDILDTVTGEKLRLTKKYLDKTAPQGSLLSPILWLLYDGCFTHFYKKLLRAAVRSTRNCISGFHHVSYADDHLTILTITVPEDFTKEQICDEIRKALTISRDLIIQATTMLGCGVNPAKSENIVPAMYHDTFKARHPDFEVKQTFKWLGYHLTLTSFAELKFERSSVVEKLSKIRKLRDSVYQYTANKRLRFKIYQVYFAPFVELYLPVVVQSADKNTEVHRFQHDCLCRAIGICYTANRRKVEEKLKLLSVDDKAIRMAKRIAAGGDTKNVQESAKRLAANTADVISEPRQLRSGRLVEGSGLARVNNNYIVRLNKIAESKLETPSITNSKFNMTEVTRWVNRINSSINSRIARINASSILGRARRRIATTR